MELHHKEPYLRRKAGIDFGVVTCKLVPKGEEMIIFIIENIPQMKTAINFCIVTWIAEELRAKKANIVMMSWKLLDWKVTFFQEGAIPLKELKLIFGVVTRTIYE